MNGVEFLVQRCFVYMCACVALGGGGGIGAPEGRVKRNRVVLTCLTLDLPHADRAWCVWLARDLLSRPVSCMCVRPFLTTTPPWPRCPTGLGEELALWSMLSFDLRCVLSCPCCPALFSCYGGQSPLPPPPSVLLKTIFVRVHVSCFLQNAILSSVSFFGKSSSSLSLSCHGCSSSFCCIPGEKSRRFFFEGRHLCACHQSLGRGLRGNTGLRLLLLAAVCRIGS